VVYILVPLVYNVPMNENTDSFIYDSDDAREFIRRCVSDGLFDRIIVLRSSRTFVVRMLPKEIKNKVSVSTVYRLLAERRLFMLCHIDTYIEALEEIRPFTRAIEGLSKAEIERRLIRFTRVEMEKVKDCFKTHFEEVQ